MFYPGGEGVGEWGGVTTGSSSTPSPQENVFSSPNPVAELAQKGSLDFSHYVWDGPQPSLPHLLRWVACSSSYTDSVLSNMHEPYRPC